MNFNFHFENISSQFAAGFCFGLFVGFALCGLLWFFTYRKRPKDKSQKELHKHYEFLLAQKDAQIQALIKGEASQIVLDKLKDFKT